MNLTGSATFSDLDNSKTVKSFEIGWISGFDSITQTGFTQFQLLTQETSNKLNMVRVHTNEINITINIISSTNNIDICSLSIYGITFKSIDSSNNDPNNEEQVGVLGTASQNIIFIAFGGIVLILILFGLFIILFCSKKNKNLRKQVLLLQPDTSKDLNKIKSVSSDDEKSYTMESIQQQIRYLESLKLKLSNQTKTGEGPNLTTKQSETIDRQALPQLPSDGVSRHKSITSHGLTIDDDSDDDIFGKMETQGE